MFRYRHRAWGLQVFDIFSKWLSLMFPRQYTGGQKCRLLKSAAAKDRFFYSPQLIMPLLLNVSIHYMQGVKQFLLKIHRQTVKYRGKLKVLPTG